ncbi:MAG: hypothetical protein LBD63_02355 [Mycoplasmataceae bacterium]|jgi:hypothetical protein|nr:hypothetical protein [Mycoplasmataceae bacterium]
MYKLKKGYLLGSNFQTIINSLKDETDIVWYEPLKMVNHDKVDTIFWANINQLLKCDYVLVDETTTNDFDLGVVWTINYIRKLLLRSGYQDAVAQLDKFDLIDKNIIGLIKTTNRPLQQVIIKDQGKLFKNPKAIVTYIKNKEK